MALLAAQVRGAEGIGWLHRDHRHELQQVTLDHVAHGSGRVVVGGAVAHAHGFGGRDLNVIDVHPVPQRLEKQVGEAKNQQVLHRLLAQVVVDAEHVVVFENTAQNAVQMLRALQVAAKGLLNDDTSTGGRVGLGRTPASRTPVGLDGADVLNDAFV